VAVVPGVPPIIMRRVSSAADGLDHFNCVLDVAHSLDSRACVSSLYGRITALRVEVQHQVEAPAKRSASPGLGMDSNFHRNSLDDGFRQEMV